MMKQLFVQLLRFLRHRRGVTRTGIVCIFARCTKNKDILSDVLIFW